MLVASITLVVIASGEAAAAPARIRLCPPPGKRRNEPDLRVPDRCARRRLTPLPGFPIGSGGTGSSVLVSAADGVRQRSLVRAQRRIGHAERVHRQPIDRRIDAATRSARSRSVPGPWTCVAAHPSGSPVVVGNAERQPRQLRRHGDHRDRGAGQPVHHGRRVAVLLRIQPQWELRLRGRGQQFLHRRIQRGGRHRRPHPVAGLAVQFRSRLPARYATDSTGRLFSVTTATSAQVRVFTTTGGVPTGVRRQPFPSGRDQAVHGVLHPAGFYIVADRNANHGVRCSGSPAVEPARR